MIQSFDIRRDLFIGETTEEAIRFAVEHWIQSAKIALIERGFFAVALSGGSTPKAVYQLLTSAKYVNQIDWSKVLLFWSDERAVPPDHPESNYRMAMECGFALLPIQIFRMHAETHLKANAKKYEELIQEKLGPDLFDLVLLGVGEDGHTASLFPHTAALDNNQDLVVANHVPQQDSWRMTLTFSCINQSKQAAFYVFGSSKQLIVERVLTASPPSPFPASFIGTMDHKALWILDAQAAKGANFS